MIISFGDADTRRVWKGERVKRWPSGVQQLGRRKLRMLNNSITLNDLLVLPGNRLEKLSGKLKQYYSIRINEQWRIIFMGQNGNAFEVAITDYH